MCDLNSRCPGSIRMITELELNNDEIPIVLIQILQFLGVQFKVKRAFQNFKKTAALMVLHSLEPQAVKTRVDFKPGIYKKQGDQWIWERRGSRLSELKDSRQILLTGGIPSGDYEILPEAPLGRIWMKQPIVDKQMIVTPDALRTSRQIYRMMNLNKDADVAS